MSQLKFMRKSKQAVRVWRPLETGWQWSERKRHIGIENRLRKECSKPKLWRQHWHFPCCITYGENPGGWKYAFKSLGVAIISYQSFVTVCKYCENDLSVHGQFLPLQSRIFIYFAPSCTASGCLELFQFLFSPMTILEGRSCLLQHL